MPTPKLSQEEIAKQFQLPERKSKIATLLKQDGREYCICNSNDSSRFMIGCDLCDRWYHGHCIGITERDSKNIERYFCIRCQGHDPTLRTVYKSSRKPIENEIKREPHVSKGRTKKDDNSDTVYTPPKKKITKGPCGSCVNCRKSTNCGSCNICKRIQKNGSRKVKEKCLNRVCTKLKPSITALAKPRVFEESSSDDERFEVHSVGVSVKPGMQCYGPGCVETARPNSKYCSDRCGLKLATNRIYQVLPQRLQEWSLTPSHAETVNKRDLETVRQKQVEARSALHELDKRQQHLEAVIARGKMLQPCFSAESEQALRLTSKKSKKGIDKEEEASIYCVTCGHEIHSSSAIKHMEKCFNKYESQASFGSMFKTRMEGTSIFCDFYNPVSKTYCKRLQVLCPEHTKDPVIGNNEACGYPLIRDVFNESNELCNFPKKLCLKHHCWDKIRRAEIDQERVRQWLKLDELLEEERQLRRRLVERAGMLGLMLHSTYDHDAMETMSSAQEEERLAQLEETLRKNYNKEQFENLSKENKRLVKTLKKTLNS